jgi:hypothetical protein
MLSLKDFMPNDKKGLSFSIVVSSLLVFLIVSCSLGPSAPPPPIPWFNEAFELEENVFHPGVDFRIVREEPNGYLDFQEFIVVSNASPTPLLFQAISDPAGFIDEVHNPCPENNLCIKVFSNQAWQWDMKFVEEDPPWIYDWVLVDDGSQPGVLKLEKIGTTIGTGTYDILTVELRNTYGFGDRPESVTVPAPQEIELPYIFDGEELHLGITITYSLNESYPASLNLTQVYALCLGGIIILIVLIFGLLLNRLLARLERKAKLRD